MDVDQKKSPFLGDHSEEEFDNLMNEYKIYSKLIEDIDQNISKISFSEPSSIQNIKNEFFAVQEKIKKINGQIKYLKNFIKDNQPKKYKELYSISDKVINKYSKVNAKFQEVLKSERATIQKEIDNSNNLDYFTTGGQYEPKEQILVNKLTYNSNPKIQNLLEIQKEYQIIYQITEDLTQITNEMKDSTERQGKAINSISDSIVDVDVNAHKANDEVQSIRKKEQKSSKGYIIFTVSLIIIFCGICGYLYFWVYNTSTKA